MKMLFLALPLALTIGSAHAQDQVVEIASIVVTDTFELRRAPTAAELFAVHLDKQFETRNAAQEAIQNSPIWNAPFWRFVPIHLENAADLQQFFVPNYASAAYRETARKLDESEANSIFEKSAK